MFWELDQSMLQPTTENKQFVNALEKIFSSKHPHNTSPETKHETNLFKRLYKFYVISRREGGPFVKIWLLMTFS